MSQQKNSFYGIANLNKYKNPNWARERQQLEEEGYFLVENVFSTKTTQEAINKLNEVNQVQTKEINGRENLALIKEENTFRVPFLYEDFFIQFFTNSKVLEILKAVYCNEFILLTQTGLINQPQVGHVGSSWHKDLPYQHFASAQPICINALVALTDFLPETGSTCFIKGSHKDIELPNDQKIEESFHQITAPAGSVIFFNSLILHKMGFNASQQPRYAINQMFGTPIFKQHINFHLMSQGKFKNDPLLSKLLDYPYAVPDSVISYRREKLAKLDNRRSNFNSEK